MPISKSEFARGRKSTELENAAIAFLRSHPQLAYSQAEIFSSIFQPSNNFLQDVANTLALGGTLNRLVRERRVLKKQVSLVDHYMWNPLARV